MKRRTWSRNINDWLGGTRGLSLRAYKLYDELCLMIADSGGRLRLDRDVIMRRLSYRDHRSFARPFDELLRAGKIVEHDDWLYQPRILNDFKLVDIALFDWQVPRAVLVAMGLDVPQEHVDIARDDLFAAPETRTVGDQSRDSSPSHGAQPTDKQRNPPKSGATHLLSTLRESLSETSSVLPRARSNVAGGYLAPRSTGPPTMTLGDGRSAGPGRFARRETALARLLQALVHAEGLALELASGLIDAALDPTHPHHAEAADRTARISRKHRCGFYPPSSGPGRRHVH